MDKIQRPSSQRTFKLWCIFVIVYKMCKKFRYSIYCYHSSPSNCGSLGPTHTCPEEIKVIVEPLDKRPHHSTLEVTPGLIDSAPAGPVASKSQLGIPPGCPWSLWGTKQNKTQRKGWHQILSAMTLSSNQEDQVKEVLTSMSNEFYKDSTDLGNTTEITHCWKQESNESLVTLTFCQLY